MESESLRPVTAEVVTIRCDRCGDELSTNELSRELAICRCGRVMLDEDGVGLYFDDPWRG